MGVLLSTIAKLDAGQFVDHVQGTDGNSSIHTGYLDLYLVHDLFGKRRPDAVKLLHSLPLSLVNKQLHEKERLLTFSTTVRLVNLKMILLGFQSRKPLLV